ncbi:hypothetical protein AB1Y20_016722 [Prymnesium parvum]|uniref:Uncharacterized protein n=1 Tax=Prymnesium parvum TaxID=97485 RepID=A0AB34IBW7_PRYPA
MKFALALLVGSTAAFSFHGAVQPNTMSRSTRPTMSVEGSPITPEIWKKSPPMKVQGNTLKTWDIGQESVERVQVSIRSDGRPIDANIELWHTPSYVPTKFSVYTEDGAIRPVDAVLETPKHPKTVAIYNTGSMEFPFDANVADTGLGKAYEFLEDVAPKKVQGGQITSYTFGAEVNSVQVLIKTEERNMKAKIELTQGPNQVKQIINVYASVGKKNPFYAVIQTPGANNAIRVVNENTVEFPFDAWVLPYEYGSESDDEPVMGGGGWM